VNREPVTVNQSADVWSIGMVMFEILSGEIPFDTNDHRNMIVDHFLEELKSGVRPSLPREFSHITWIKKLVSMLNHIIDNS
jgi:serine/threonine protein kinase